MKELRALACTQNRRGYSRLRKAELITLLRTPRIIVLDANGQEITNAQVRREKKNTWLRQPRPCPHCSKKITRRNWARHQALHTKQGLTEFNFDDDLFRTDNTSIAEPFSLIESESALDDFVRKYTIRPQRNYIDPRSFFEVVKGKIVDLLRSNPSRKVRMVLKGNMERYTTTELRPQFRPAYFNSWNEFNLPSTHLEDLYQRMIEKIFESIDGYNKEGYYKFGKVLKLELHMVEYKPSCGNLDFQGPLFALARKQVMFKSIFI